MWAVIWDISESFIHILWNLGMTCKLKTCSWKCSYKNQYCRWKWENLFRKWTTACVADHYLRLRCFTFVVLGGGEWLQFPYWCWLIASMNTIVHIWSAVWTVFIGEIFLLNVELKENLTRTCIFLKYIEQEKKNTFF